MAKLGSLAVGDIVSLTYNGAATDFIIIQQGNPDSSFYDSSCDGTWLMNRYVYDELQWNVSNSNIFTSSKESNQKGLSQTK
jgi:hypothetical protein